MSAPFFPTCLLRLPEAHARAGAAGRSAEALKAEALPPRAGGPGGWELAGAPSPGSMA